MDEEQSEGVPGFRFGLRSLLLMVTGFCLVAGMFWFVSLILLFLMGAIAVQIGVFLAIQRFANRIAGKEEKNSTGQTSRSKK